MEALKEAVETKAPKTKELKKYKVTIHSEGEGGDKGDVLIGHNFKLIQIKRDCEVVIDENFLGVLKSTVIDTMVKDGEGKMKPAKVPRYNFTTEPV
jgi:hypothetical protein